MLKIITFNREKPKEVSRETFFLRPHRSANWIYFWAGGTTWPRTMHKSFYHSIKNWIPCYIHCLVLFRATSTRHNCVTINYKSNNWKLE